MDIAVAQQASKLLLELAFAEEVLGWSLHPGAGLQASMNSSGGPGWETVHIPNLRDPVERVLVEAAQAWARSEVARIKACLETLA